MSPQRTRTTLAIEQQGVEAAPDEPAYAGAVAETRDALWELMVRYGDPYAGHRYGAGRYLKGYSKGELRRSWD